MFNIETDVSLNHVIIAALSVLALGSIVVFEFGLYLLVNGDHAFVVWGIIYIATLSEMITTAMIALCWADMILRKRRAKRDALNHPGT